MGSARRRLFVPLFAVLLVRLLSSQAHAWGPATHVKLAGDLLAHAELLPASLAALLLRHRRAFIYGNVATDTVFAKKMSRIKQICHHWSTGFALLRSARTDDGRAFAHGYLAHLAADTVAHNQFLPRQMAVARSTVTFGHLYWELRADAPIERAYWARLRNVLHDEPSEAESLLRTALTDTLLSFKANRVIFKRMNLLASLKGWRRSVEFWGRLSRYPLDPAVLAAYHAESVLRIRDVLTRGEASPVLHLDPNGNAALDYARAQRRQLRQFKRANIPHGHVIEEAAFGHAPGRSAVTIRLIV